MGFQDPLDRIPTSRIQCSCLGGVTRIRLVVLDMSTFFVTVTQQKQLRKCVE
ncbi:hypothetical protein Hanom_Chr13g01235801 [Helianthus anomalus]